MSRLPVALGVLIASPLSWACGDALLRVEDGVALRTDRNEYLARPAAPGGDSWEFELVATYENLTNLDLYISRCDSTPRYGVSIAGDPGGSAAYDPVWACAGQEPFLVEPGGVRTDTLNLLGGPPGLFEGDFRLSYRARFCIEPAHENCDAPLHLQVSDPFTVRLER